MNRKQCIATRPSLDPTRVIQCKKPATHGDFCRMHAQSLGGWVLVKPETGYKYGEFHRRTVELTSLLHDAVEIQRRPCDHRGIGYPGCIICDPRLDFLRAASRLSFSPATADREAEPTDEPSVA